MDDQLTLRYDELSRSHFWLTSKKYVIEQYLESHLRSLDPLGRVLEVGCCAGHYLQQFIGRADEVHGLDMSISALRRCHTDNPGIKNVQGDGLQLPYADGSFDLVLMQDVLEHIEDDVATLRGLHRVLRDDGMFFVCVPAYMFLYGHHDKLFGHVRRYTRGELRGRLEETGFKIVRASYFQSPFLAPLYVKRRFGKKDGDDFIIPPKAVNTFFDKMLRLESIPMKAFDLPFGPTLMCVARKVA